VEAGADRLGSPGEVMARAKALNKPQKFSAVSKRALRA
jgi:hypothetical protein